MTVWSSPEQFEARKRECLLVKWISLVDYSPAFCAIIGSIATNRTRKIGVILTTLFPVFPRSPVITAHLIPPLQRSTYEKINHPCHNIPPSLGWQAGLRPGEDDAVEIHGVGSRRRCHKLDDPTSRRETRITGIIPRRKAGRGDRFSSSAMTKHRFVATRITMGLFQLTERVKKYFSLALRWLPTNKCERVRERWKPLFERESNVTIGTRNLPSA